VHIILYSFPLAAFFSGTASGSQLSEPAVRPHSRTPNEDGRVAELLGVQYVLWYHMRTLIHAYMHTHKRYIRTAAGLTTCTTPVPCKSSALFPRGACMFHLSHHSTYTLHAIFKSAGFWYITVAMGFNLAIRLCLHMSNSVDRVKNITWQIPVNPYTNDLQPRTD
jgi:hypothetical protein